MEPYDRLQQAIQLFDEANSQDPNTESYQGKEYPKEVLYAIRMSRQLDDFYPDAPDYLKLAARCQHICRWEIPRDTYGMNREGYLRWRRALKKFHAKKAATILESIGYDRETIDKVTFLLEKKQLKKNRDTQILEDVVCLVFLEYYFEPFARKYPEDKTIDIIQKTWRKMSEKGHAAAFGLSLSENIKNLISKAI